MAYARWLLALGITIAAATVMLITCLAAHAQIPPVMAPVWRGDGPGNFGNMGYSTASGDINADGYADLVVGLPFWTSGGGGGSPNIGYVFVFYGSISGPSTVPSWTFQGPILNDSCGFSVAATDVNGDEYADVIVGTAGGPLRAFHGSASGLPPAPNWISTSGSEDVVAAAGDVNADGYGDVIVGTGEYSFVAGRVAVYHGSASGLEALPAWTYASGQSGDNFGNAVAGAGDVNNDGYDDVIVSARRYDNGQLDEGRAWVFHGSASGLPLAPSWTYESDAVDVEIGRSVAGVGDIDDDGHDDVVIGVISLSRALVFRGSASGLPTTPSSFVEGDAMSAYFGWEVASAGDYNDDGYGDVIVSDFGYPESLEGGGRVYVYFGAASGLATTPAWIANAEQEQSWFGYDVADAGDVNGDGLNEVIVGAPHFDVDGPSPIHKGGAYLFSPVTHPGSLVPSGDDTALQITKETFGRLTMSWAAACGGETDYEIYAGAMGSFASHAPLTCGTRLRNTYTFTPPAGSVYYLVVPRSFGREGSYGLTSAGIQRPAAAAACLPQEIASCP